MDLWEFAKWHYREIERIDRHIRGPQRYNILNLQEINGWRGLEECKNRIRGLCNSYVVYSFNGRSTP